MNLRAALHAARRAGPVLQPDGARVLEFVFPPDAVVFDGHFPGRPILPGVLQLELVRLAAEWVMDCRLGVKEIVRGKFQRAVPPGEILSLRLNLEEAGGIITARAQLACGGLAAGESILKLWRNES